MDILVASVGRELEPVVTAIRELRPNRVIFLCSADIPGSHGSHRLVQDIFRQTGLPDGSYEIGQIEYFDDLQECYRRSRDALLRLHKEHPDARVLANYTGGTKSMTAGLALAAVDDPTTELSLVAGTRTNIENISPGTQYEQPVAVWDVRAQRRIEGVNRRINDYDYAGAAS